MRARILTAEQPQEEGFTMGQLYQETFEDARQLALETNNIRLMSLLLEPEDAWAMLSYFTKYTEEVDGKQTHPYYKDFQRFGKSKKDPEKDTVRASYVANVKTAIRRYEALKKALPTEPAHSVYSEYQKAEMDILNAYAIRVIMDLVKSDNTILDGIGAKMAAWDAAQAAEKAKQAAEAE